LLAESRTTWITSSERVTCRGYTCVFSKRHVVELHELAADERDGFLSDVATVMAKAFGSALQASGGQS
jgi:diadenosine tetraphosphate (Ap4A) HIT family hydrolase